MIQTVQERKKNIHNFMESYPNLCRLQNIVPNPNIKVNSSNNFLDFVGDRLKSEEWKPLLEAISNDRSLHFISIKSKYNYVKASPKSPVNKEESDGRQNSTPKSYASITSETVLKLAEALSKCLSNSVSLTGLLLEKLSLGPESLNQITQGLEACRNLQQLSLPYCQIGDDGCSSLCHILRRRLNLVWLNLSGCNLTEKGVGMLCDLLKFQKLNRYGESWKQSLRYRPVNPNTMPGLRRLTLNHNPVGDAGVKIFVDTLLDDLWLKALDLQNCGITLLGAEQLLNLVKENQFLSVVDIRGNVQVPKSLVAAVVQQLAENNMDTIPEFQWLKEESSGGNGRSSSSGASVSRSSQRLVSNTTLCSKGRSVLTVLPSKSRVSTIPSMTQWNRARSASAKRAHTTNNSPRPPWNSNQHSGLRRGNSDQHMMHNNKKSNQDILVELNSLKDQLQEVRSRLEEETERRIKIEQQLDNYKKIIPLPENLTPTDSTIIKKVFEEIFSHNKSQNVTDPSVPQKDKQQEEKDNIMDNLDFLIRTVNGVNALNLNYNNQNEDEGKNPSTQKESPSRAQKMFETLISS